jgi:hypothetical protein
MSPPIMAPPLAGNVIGSVAANFVVAEWKDAGGPPGPPRWIAPLHLHRHDDQAWYVIEGTLCVRVGNDVVEAKAGSAVFVPRRTPHTYWNLGAGPVLARYDGEYLFADSGYSRHDGPVSGGAAGSV